MADNIWVRRRRVIPLGDQNSIQSVRRRVVREFLAKNQFTISLNEKEEVL